MGPKYYIIAAMLIILTLSIMNFIIYLFRLSKLFNQFIYLNYSFIADTEIPSISISAVAFVNCRSPNPFI